MKKLDFSTPPGHAAKTSIGQVVGLPSNAHPTGVSPIVKAATSLSFSSVQMKKEPTTSLSFSADQIKKAASAASQGGPTSLIFTRTPVLNPDIICGAIALVPAYNKNAITNKQFWGFKAYILKQIFNLFTGHSEFAIIQPFVEKMEQSTIISRQHSRDQDDVLSRSKNGTDYPFEALTFVIDATGSVTSAVDLFNILAKKISSILMHKDFRLCYQQMCEASAELGGLGKTIKSNQNFWNTFKRVVIVEDVAPLDKFLPDEFIIKLVASGIGNDVPNTWPADVVAACWKDGLPREYFVG